MSSKPFSEMTEEERGAFALEVVQRMMARPAHEQLRELIADGTIDENGQVLLWTLEDQAQGVPSPDRSPEAIAKRLRKFDEQAARQQADKQRRENQANVERSAEQNTGV